MHSSVDLGIWLCCISISKLWCLLLLQVHGRFDRTGAQQSCYLQKPHWDFVYQATALCSCVGRSLVRLCYIQSRWYLFHMVVVSVKKNPPNPAVLLSCFFLQDLCQRWVGLERLTTNVIHTSWKPHRFGCNRVWAGEQAPKQWLCGGTISLVPPSVIFKINWGTFLLNSVIL